MKTEHSEPSAEYLAALAKANEASRIFRGISWEYRNRKIGDAEFLAARKTHETAQAEFDRALLAELERGNA